MRTRIAKINRDRTSHPHRTRTQPRAAEKKIAPVENRIEVTPCRVIMTQRFWRIHHSACPIPSILASRAPRRVRFRPNKTEKNESARGKSMTRRTLGELVSVGGKG